MCSRCTACPFTSAVFSETHEGSGSKPGGCFKPGLSTDFEGLIGKPSSSSRLYSEVEGTLGAGRCCLCSCREGCLQLLIVPPPPHPRLPLWTQRLLSPGQLRVHRPLFQSCKLALPSRSPQAGALAAGSHFCQQEGSTGVHRRPGRPSFPRVGPIWSPQLTLARFLSPDPP